MDISSVFFRIADTSEQGGRVHYFGGNQSWFDDPIGRAAGCGTIAATNVWIQNFLCRDENFVRRQRLLEAEYSVKEQLSSQKIAAKKGRMHKQGILTLDRSEFMQIAYMVRRFVRPARVFDVPLGIWPSSSFIRMFRKLLESRGEKVEFSKFSPSSNTEKLVRNIIESLQMGNPLFMLIGVSDRFRKLNLEYLNQKEVVAEDASMHWVLILGIFEMDGEYYLKTSSWGGILFLRLKDWQKGFWPNKILRWQIQKGM